jgi:hypothetical protein
MKSQLAHVRKSRHWVLKAKMSANDPERTAGPSSGPLDQMTVRDGEEGSNSRIRNAQGSFTFLTRG